MVLPDLVAIFVDPLETLGIPYMITGGVASVIYGDPRFTRDIDIVLQLNREDAGRFASGFDPDDYYVPPVDVIAADGAGARAGTLMTIADSTARGEMDPLGPEPDPARKRA